MIVSTYTHGNWYACTLDDGTSIVTASDGFDLFYVAVGRMTSVWQDRTATRDWWRPRHRRIPEEAREIIVERLPFLEKP